MFYLIEIAQGDAKIAGKAVYEYDNKTSALAAFHSKLGTAMNSELYTHEQIMVIGADNSIYASETFDRTAE